MRKSKNILESFYFAFRGLFQALRGERNFQIQFSVAFITVVLGFILKFSKGDWILILILAALVLSLELINSSFERMLNVIHPSDHPAIKVAKDFLAAGVLIASVIALVAGLIIISNYF
ncbi:diacylglycerol kinase [Patescibacteria group bacterium]|nr:diacylglycerol kinase [Patescibacteria group bacterium]